eukprot:gb/GFBE01024148.1/.p1 GENE.gb/GFBE01024148.1/~~gb/GFBE01024148.1/.p1  ORF type:complete len:350 (+),score=39.05 gb/GFBE01024148.1/:1-1050(+)
MPGRFCVEVPASQVPPGCKWGDLAPRSRAPVQQRQPAVASSRSTTSLETAGERMMLRQLTCPVGRALRVIIYGAKNLVNKDTARWEKPDCSDPYVICEIPGKPRGRIITPVVWDTLHPVWNYESRVHDFVAASDKLVFTVYDRDTDKRDDLLGSAELTASEIWPRGFEGNLELIEPRPRAQKAYLQVKVTEEEVEQLAELMATLGPRYRALGRGEGPRLASCWSEESYLTRRLRREEALRSTAVKTGPSRNSRRPRRDGDPLALKDENGVPVQPWTLARSRHSYQQSPHRELAMRSTVAHGPSAPAMCETWHGKPLPYSADNPVAGHCLHRFAASVPHSSHPAVHLGVR